MGEEQSPTTPGTDGSRASRLHYLDLLRAFLMLVGLPYHAALAFSGRSWAATSPNGAPALGFFADFTHIWRMPTFFVVAGLFAGLIIARRGPGRWLNGRVKRLGIPLLFGLIVISPLQLLVLGVVNRLEGESLLHAWQRQAAWAGSWVGHLWFLVYLLIFCALFALAVRLGLWSRAAGALRRWAHTVAQSAWTAFVAAFASSALIAVAFAGWKVLRLPQATQGVFDPDFPVSAAFFTAGLVLALVPSMFEEVRSPSRATVVIGITTVLVAAASAHALQEWDSRVATLLNATLVTLAGWYAAVLLFALATRFARRGRARW